MHVLTQMVQRLAKGEAKPTLDSIATEADDDAQAYALTNLTLLAAAAIQVWVETADDDLDDGETLAGRLMGTLLGIADPDLDDEELGEDESGVFDLAREAAWDYLTSKGVADDDADALLNDWNNDAAVRIRDLLLASLPDGEAASEDIDGFTFDSAAKLDAVHKMKVALGKGEKRTKNRASGKVTLSPKHKLSVRKAHRAAHSAKAIMRRVNSAD